MSKAKESSGLQLSQNSRIDLVTIKELSGPDTSIWTFESGSSGQVTDTLNENPTGTPKVDHTRMRLERRAGWARG